VGGRRSPAAHAAPLVSGGGAVRRGGAGRGAAARLSGDAAGDASDSLGDGRGSLIRDTVSTRHAW